MLLTVIVPVYNEERRIAASLPLILTYLQSQRYPWELLVVEDGSRDKTCEVTRRILVGAPQARLISFPYNRGKGFAIRQGVHESCGQYVLFLDVDLSVPIEKTAETLKLLQEGWEVVIGSRAHALSRILKAQPLFRRIGASIFKALRDLLVGLSQYPDSQCGFKAFRGDLARWVFSRGRVDGFMFDVETLCLLDKIGCKIFELPVDWTNSEESRLRLVKDTIRMFKDLSLIRYWHRHPTGRKVNL